MDWTKIPPLNSLRAFSALAAAGTYAQAGRILNVTHAAVRQQVRQLEEHLQVTLVDRAGRGMVLTEEGRMLARELDAGFGRIARATETLRFAGASRPLRALRARICQYQLATRVNGKLLTDLELVYVLCMDSCLVVRPRNSRAPPQGRGSILNDASRKKLLSPQI